MISSLAEVNVLALTRGLVFVADQLGNVTGATFNDLNSNNTDIYCKTLTAFSSVTSDVSINGSNCTITNTLGLFLLWTN